MNAKAHLVEIFSGVQGEGVHVGARQIFVRLAGCNLACTYCDTPESRQPALWAKVETRAGGRDFRMISNPVSADSVAGLIERLDAERYHHSISLTGGEPLLWTQFITELASLCGGRKIYLETNGTLPAQLREVISLVHVVAMDIKLKSAAGRGVEPSVVREFLQIASERDVFVKVVVSAQTTADELAEAAQIVAQVGKSIPLVIQPVTPTNGIEPPDEESLLELQRLALAQLEDVRVIPQVHKLMGQK